MTQKLSTEKLGSVLLQTIDPKEIAEEQMRQTVEILLNLIEQLNSRVKDLEAENQKLRDENNRLKGEQGKPDLKANKVKRLDNNYSSEKERKTPKKHSKGRKTENIKIDREKILEYPQDKLPADAEFKGYEQVIVQDIKLSTDNILKNFWDYYRELLAYRDAPSPKVAEELRAEFELLFGSDSGYQQLDERKRLTATKISELLLVLEHPELPLHNNPAELGARTMVQRRNISYGTQTTEGTKAWDNFMSLVATTRKLGISFFEYVRDRICETGTIPPLAAIIREKSSLHSLGWSWQTE